MGEQFILIHDTRSRLAPIITLTLVVICTIITNVRKRVCWIVSNNLWKIRIFFDININIDRSYYLTNDI